MIFFVLSGDMLLFLPENMIFFLWTENERWSFSRNTWKCDIFFKCSKKMVFPTTKAHWNMIFFVLSGKMVFLFPENMILFFRQKMRDDLSQKIHGYIIFFSNVLERWYFQKNRIGILSFNLERRHFFTRKYIFSLDGKWKVIFLKKYMDRKWEMIFLKKHMEIWYFLYICTNVTNIWYYPSAKKTQRWSSPEKIHLKLTDILDWHSRKISNDSMYFYGDFHRRFHIMLSSEEKQET